MDADPTQWKLFLELTIKGSHFKNDNLVEPYAWFWFNAKNMHFVSQIFQLDPVR